MNNNPQVHVYKFKVGALTNQQRADELKKFVHAETAVEKVDINLPKRMMRIISSDTLDLKKLGVKLAAHNFHLERIALEKETYADLTLASDALSAPVAQQKIQVGIQGMTCRSCELIIERKWKKLPGVKRVEVSAATGKARLTIEGARPSKDALQKALGDQKYQVYESNEQTAQIPRIPEGRPSVARLVGLFASVIFIGYLLSRLNLFNTNISFGSQMTFGTIFVIGLVAAASSCLAVAGGLLLSSMARFNERYHSATRIARLRPVLMFVGGRIAGYGFFGGLLGVVGKAIVPSPFFTGILIILAALYMFIMGMEMLHIAPAWLKRLMPRMPKGLSHRILEKESSDHPLMPFALGAATFFLPCGFTQALQLYALTTGSFTASFIALFAFALGTAPSLIALGWASGSLKGKVGKLFFQFSGALVIVLGVWNFQNGLNIIGYPLSLPGSGSGKTAVGSPQADTNATDVEIKNGVQVVKMGIDDYGYAPDTLTVRAGTPVRWEVDGTNASGCISVLVSRKLGIQQVLKPGNNVFEFTPEEAGEIPFSCSMGMFRGKFVVLPPS